MNDLNEDHRAEVTKELRMLAMGRPDAAERLANLLVPVRMSEPEIVALPVVSEPPESKIVTRKVKAK